MKDKTVAALLALFLGWAGGHKFYLGRPVQGVLYFLFSWTFIPSVIAFVEFLVYLTMSQERFDLKYNQEALLLAGRYGATPPQVVIQQQFGAPSHGHVPHAGHPAGAAWGHPHHGVPPAHSPHGVPPAHPPHGVPHGHAPRIAAASSGVSMEEAISQLERLNELRISGAITEQEFQMKKAALLGE